MKAKTAAILGAALLLLGAIAYLAERAATTKAEAQIDRSSLLNGYAPSAVTRLEIRTGIRTTILTRLDAGWVVSPEGHAADRDAVTVVLGKLASLDRRQLASRKLDRHATMNVDRGNAEATEVKAWLGGDEVRFHLLVGKTGGDFRSNFVRLANETEVYQSHELISDALDRGGRGFQDLRILEFAVADVTRLAVRGGDEAWVAVRGTDGWTIEEPAAAGAADTESLEDLLRALAVLSGDEPALPSAALGEVQARVTVTLRDDREVELLIGEPAGDKVHVRRADDDRLYAIFLHRAPSLVKPLERVVKQEPEPSARVPPPTE